MLSLYECNIGDRGVCHLANALKNNTVKNKLFACLYIYLSFSFGTDSYNTESLS
jgi:hypothetical protein